MDKKIFEPDKYGMALCPSCNGQGYLETPERQCCPKCGGFGFIKKGTENTEKVRCPVCAGSNIHENSKLLKAESGDWGICMDCHHTIRLEIFSTKWDK